MADHLITIERFTVLNAEIVFKLHNFLAQALNEDRRIVVTLEESGAIIPDEVDKQDKRHGNDRKTLGLA